MTKIDFKNKKTIFLAGVGGLLLVLIIILVIFMLKGPKDDSPSSSSGLSSLINSDLTQSDNSEFESDLQSQSGDEIGTSSTTIDQSDSESGSVLSEQLQSGKTSEQEASSKPKESSISVVSSSTSQPSEKVYSLFSDPNFENGFKVFGMSTADGGNEGSFVFNPLESSGRQYWQIAQWGSRYSFADSAHTKIKKLGNGVFSMDNTTKVFTIDTKTNKMTFTGLASKCYDTHRTGSEPWLHLLISQGFVKSKTKVSELKSVVVKHSNRLTMFEDHMGSAFNPSSHAAQFLMYFSVSNNDINSPELNRYLWFGFPFFDNRHEWNEASSMYDKGTNSLMVGIGNRVLYQTNGKNNCWKNGKINASPNAEWSSFELDVLPLIKQALITAHKDGYLLQTSLEQLVISGMNMGWEIPGTYDATMEVKDFSVTVTAK